MVKDSRKDNIFVVDPKLLDFIHHMHLTTKGLVDVDNKLKSDWLVFDSSYQPDPTSTSINNWVSKETEGGVTFAGSFVRFLTWIWNMRISYPNTAILLGDDDVTNAFRLIKNNPAVVGMHGFTACKQLTFCTGMTFEMYILQWTSTH